MVVTGQAAEQLALLNAYRARHGLEPVVVVPQLVAAADRHAADMVAKRFFAHEGSDGSTPATRAAEAGYPGHAGENLGLRSATAAAQMAGWIMSPPHHNNLLDPTWKAIGIAAVNGPDGVLWVNVFGDRVTCPTGTEIPPTPVVLVNPVQARPAGTLGAGSTDNGPVAPVASDTPLLAPTELPAAVAPAASTPTASTATALAVMVADRTPRAGQTLTVVNRSRDQGVPRTVGIAGSPSPMTEIGPDATRRFALLDPGTFTLQFAANGYPSVLLTIELALPVTGDPQAPVVRLATPPAAVAGELVTLSATVTQPSIGAASGRAVRFTLGGLSVVGSTDDAGVATVTLRANLAPATWPLRAEVLTDAGAVAAVDEISLTLGANLIPVAVAGGPYTSNIGDSVTLDASGSYDADGEGLDYAWDLNADGAYVDATGPHPEVAWVDLQRIVCGGLCDTDAAQPIGLRVTDPKGGSADDNTTLTFTRDFRVVVAPETLTIVPGSSNSFVVDVVSTSGFTGAVTLTAAGLPAGATAVFTPATITPGQESTMKVTLPADVGGVEVFDISVTGTSGSIVRTASSVVDVVFGLPPRCTTSVEGTVLDAESGVPLVGAALRVSAADGTRNLVTDAAGHWRIDAASPSTTNQPGPVSRRIDLAGYWYKDLKATATCGVPMVLEDRLVPIHKVHLVGRVQIGAQDPTDFRKLVPTGAVAPDTTVTIVGASQTVVSGAHVDSDGYIEADVPLAYENAAASYTVQGVAPGFWPTNVSLDVVEGGSPFADVLIRVKCTAHITGGRVVDELGVPIANAKVISTAANKQATSGPDGRYTIDADVPLAVANTSGSTSLAGNPPPDRTDLQSTTTTVALPACGDILTADIVIRKAPVPPPITYNYGTVAGTVTDADTHLPVAGANVTADNTVSTLTAADGTYRLTGVLVGANSTTSRNVAMSVTKVGYWNESASVAVTKDQTSTFDRALAPRRTGTVEGIVHDQVTGAALPGARVAVSSLPAVIADAAGHFTVTGVPLNAHNAPALTSIDATLAGYWPRHLTVETRDGVTTTADVSMLRECATVEVRGLVLNAETRQPIPGAKITSTSYSAIAGDDGRFALTNIRMQPGNTPWQLTLTASATGFVSQTRAINVFCGARINVDFGKLPSSPAVITGLVTDKVTGAPLADVFVGTGFGGGMRTGIDGRYRFDGVPTNDDGTPLDWDVAVLPDTDDPHLPSTKTVTVRPGATSTADFALSLPAPPNQPPVAVVTQPGSTAEGTSVTLDASGSTDPEGGALSFAWDLDGDGAYDDATGVTVSITLPVAGITTVAVQVTDAAGATSTATATVVAANVSPTVNAGADVTLGFDGRLVRAGSFVDPGADTFQATVDYGEGAGSQPLPLDASKSFALDHTYPAGQWTLAVTVCDGHGGCGQDTVGVTVPNPPPPNRVPVAQPVDVTTPQDTAVAVTLAATDADGDGLTYQIVSGPSHGTLTGTAPALTYEPATGYSGADSITYTASDGKATSVPAVVSITITPAPNTVQLLLSDDAARRTNVRPLDGQTLRNGVPMYAFVGPDAAVPTINQVRFYLDDPQGTAAPFSVENEISWDFARTAANKTGCTTCADSPAHPFESNLLSLGAHTITAAVDFKDGRPSVVLTSTFTIADTTPHGLLVSTKADRSAPGPLAGAALSGSRYVFLGAAQDIIAGASSVSFVLDGKAGLTEGLVPYDLMGTATDGKAKALDTKRLAVGPHTLQAIVALPEGTQFRYQATFTVSR